MTQISHRGFYSSDDTEFIRRFPAETITHGFSRRRPVRSLQIPPEVEKSPTDFTDLHRFFLGRYFCHADFADDADFFLMGFYSSDDTEFIRRFPAETIIHGFSQMRPVRSLQIPPETDKEIHQRFHKKSVYICEICGTKKLRRKICVICEICVTKNNRSIYRARTIGQRPKFCENP